MPGVGLLPSCERFQVRPHYALDPADLGKSVRIPNLRFPSPQYRDFSPFSRPELLHSLSQSPSFINASLTLIPPSYVFTEHGAVMAANILRSERAIQMSVFVVRAFVKMRAMLTAQKNLASKLAALEKTRTRRLDLHQRVISYIIQQIMSLLNPAPEPDPPRKDIGFHVREGRAIYKSKRLRVKL